MSLSIADSTPVAAGAAKQPALGPDRASSGNAFQSVLYELKSNPSPTDQAGGKSSLGTGPDLQERKQKQVQDAGGQKDANFFNANALVFPGGLSPDLQVAALPQLLNGATGKPSSPAGSINDLLIRTSANAIAPKNADLAAPSAPMSQTQNTEASAQLVVLSDIRQQTHFLPILDAAGSSGKDIAPFGLSSSTLLETKTSALLSESVGSSQNVSLPFQQIATRVAQELPAPLEAAPNVTVANNAPVAPLTKIIELTLQPPDLGSVSVQLRLSGQNLSLALKAEPQTLRSLEADRGHLSAALAQSGYRVDDLRLIAVAPAAIAGGEGTSLQNNHFGNGATFSHNGGGSSTPQRDQSATPSTGPFDETSLVTATRAGTYL